MRICAGFRGYRCTRTPSPGDEDRIAQRQDQKVRIRFHDAPCALTLR
jgi:hypothetical protein